MRKKAATSDSGLEIRQRATLPSLRWPETGGTLAHWRYSRGSRRGKHLAAPQLRYGSASEVIDAVEELF